MRIRPIDGACFCIAQLFGEVGSPGQRRSWFWGGEAGDDLGGRVSSTGARGLDDLRDLVAADREVDAAEEAVAVAGGEHRVAVVAEPRGPVQVALVAALGAQRLGAVGVVGGHVAEPVDLARRPSSARGVAAEKRRRGLAQVAAPACARRARTGGSRSAAPGSWRSASWRVEPLSSSRLRANGRRSSNAGPSTAASRAVSLSGRGRLRERARAAARRRAGRSGPARRSPRGRRSRPRRARSGRVSDWPTVVVSRLKLWISRARFSLRWATSRLSSRQVPVDRPDRAEQLAEVLVAAVEPLAGADQQQLQVGLRVGVERRRGSRRG